MNTKKILASLLIASVLLSTPSTASAQAAGPVNSYKSIIAAISKYSVKCKARIKSSEIAGKYQTNCLSKATGNGMTAIILFTNKDYSVYLAKIVHANLVNVLEGGAVEAAFSEFANIVQPGWDTDGFIPWSFGRAAEATESVMLESSEESAGIARLHAKLEGDGIAQYIFVFSMVDVAEAHVP